MSLYVSQATLDERKQQRERIAAKYGDGMVPIVLEAVGKNAKVNFTALPSSATVADLQTVVRELGGASRRRACSLVVGGATPSSPTTLGELSGSCVCAADGFLYVSYLGEASSSSPATSIGCGIPILGSQSTAMAAVKRFIKSNGDDGRRGPAVAGDGGGDVGKQSIFADGVVEGQTNATTAEEEEEEGEEGSSSTALMEAEGRSGGCGEEEEEEEGNTQGMNEELLVVAASQWSEQVEGEE